MVEVIFHFNSQRPNLGAFVTTGEWAAIAGGKLQVVRAFKRSNSTDSGDNVNFFVRFWSLDYVERADG